MTDKCIGRWSWFYDMRKLWNIIQFKNAVMHTSTRRSLQQIATPSSWRCDVRSWIDCWHVPYRFANGRIGYLPHINLSYKKYLGSLIYDSTCNFSSSLKGWIWDTRFIATFLCVIYMKWTHDVDDMSVWLNVHISHLFFLNSALWGYCHCGHFWPIVPASGDSEDDCGEADGMSIGRGNRSSRRKSAPAPLLSTIKSHMTRPRIEPGPPRWEAGD
jgi:hypothetical protein